ncbi:MAG TPA: D-Ala-D-Ala carboxypeptidase family metallohydrolase [Fervidobacterium sp.]|nr:D-Ala-D-Ala carboxypeptidase family metallohydrolase [Fervidobacterium sp.]
MITMQELLKDAKFEDQSQEIQDNLVELLVRINKVRAAYGKPMNVTSGLRSMADHLRIYAQKGITDQSKIPMQSNHLYGRAVDISDPNRELQAWVLKNVKLMEEIGLWMEDFGATPNWLHFQINPPKSGNRFFKP